jgi:hypothetical protein
VHSTTEPPLPPPLVPRRTPCSGRFHRQVVPLLPSSCTHKASTLACWPDRAAGSSEQSFQRPLPPASAMPALRSSPRREWVRKSSPSEPWTLPSCLLSQDRRRARRNPADRAAPMSQGLHCKAPSNSGVFCAKLGPSCEPPDLSKGLLAKWFLPLFNVLAGSCKIHIKSQKNPKIAKPIFLCSVWLNLPFVQRINILLNFSFCLKNWNVFYLDPWFCKIHTWSWAGFWICCEH